MTYNKERLGNKKQFRFQSTLMSGLLAFTLLTVSAPAFAGTYTLKAAGLTCPFCSYGIEKSLKRIKGVTRVKVNIKTGTVRVKTRSGVKLTEAQARRAVTKAGFSMQSFQ